jgi:hypothetical protein
LHWALFSGKACVCIVCDDNTVALKNNPGFIAAERQRYLALYVEVMLWCLIQACLRLMLGFFRAA